MSDVNPKAAKGIVLFGFSLIFFVLFLIIDFGFITPKILPEDQCYYHFHKTPLWVDLLYMSEGTNRHPDWTFFHIILLLVISIFLGIMLSKKLFPKN